MKPIRTLIALPYLVCLWVGGVICSGMGWDRLEFYAWNEWQNLNRWIKEQ